jgi:hypothetical protein
VGQHVEEGGRLADRGGSVGLSCDSRHGWVNFARCWREHSMRGGERSARVEVYLAISRG